MLFDCGNGRFWIAASLFRVYEVVSQFRIESLGHTFCRSFCPPATRLDWTRIYCDAISLLYQCIDVLLPSSSRAFLEQGSESKGTVEHKKPDDCVLRLQSGSIHIDGCV